jgi:hypothetical protein
MPRALYGMMESVVGGRGDRAKYRQKSGDRICESPLREGRTSAIPPQLEVHYAAMREPYTWLPMEKEYPSRLLAESVS